MKVADYDYQLPPELIAQFPAERRTASRLLKVSAAGALSDHNMIDIVGELRSGDLLVLNDTKVIPARLFGRKDTGGRIEILLERITGANSVLAQIKSSKAPKPGQSLIVDGDDRAQVRVSGRQESFFELTIDVAESLETWFERVGHMPLPPYIERADQVGDGERYQTVFAKQLGAVAAPTAGLHYDQKLLQQITQMGVQTATVTLHVGAGTYQPVRVASVEQHKMHFERVAVSQAVCDAVIACKQRGGRVVAVGTTVVRSLESAAQSCTDGLIQPFNGETDIFIYPGYQFKVVDLLQTNFHLPQSTLLMLVSAFAGKQRIMHAYQHAIEQKYRFFSYGDAMLLERSR